MAEKPITPVKKQKPNRILRDTDILTAEEIAALKDRAKKGALKSVDKIANGQMPYKIVDLVQKLKKYKYALLGADNEFDKHTVLPDELVPIKGEYERLIAKTEKLLDVELAKFGQSLLKADAK